MDMETRAVRSIVSQHHAMIEGTGKDAERKTRDAPGQQLDNVEWGKPQSLTIHHHHLDYSGLSAHTLPTKPTEPHDH